MERLLTFALRDHILKHVSEVNNGKKCNCICPACKATLIAKNNPQNKKIAHFAHSSGADCLGAYESALHLLAKKILSDTKEMMLPDYHFDYDTTNDQSVYAHGRMVQFDEVELECIIIDSDMRIIPDIIATVKQKKLFVEFAKTHFVDYNKKVKLLKLQKPCIEIDLKDQILDEHALSEFFKTKSTSIYWICNPIMDNQYKSEREAKRLEYIEYLKQLKQQDEQKKVQLDQYRDNSNVKVYEVMKGLRISECPLRQNLIAELMSTSFYKQPILKKIIDGGDWNFTIYGYYPNARYIYVNREKVVIYAARGKNAQANEKTKQNDFLYAGLKTIIERFEKSMHGICHSCAHSIESLTIENSHFEICGYPNNNRETV